MFSVLYIEDEASLLEITRPPSRAEREFVVDTAISAEEELEKLRKKRSDAIISDYHMPGMNGIAFLKEVRFRFGTIPYILFTGRGRVAPGGGPARANAGRGCRSALSLIFLPQIISGRFLK
jgi:CheY-like chemotaxis protein